MNELKFTHKISKGSRYNQIYVPLQFENDFEVGDLVEVRLLRRQEKLFYSKDIKKLGEFKEKIIKDVFNFLEKYKEIEQIYIFGSFLFKREDYNDIDLLIISDKGEIEKDIYEAFVNRFNLRFHVISISKEKLELQFRIDPIFRNIIYSSISNKNIDDLPDIEIDERHIRYLMMLPNDVLDVDVNTEMLYNALRKIIVIENFLRNKNIASENFSNELIKLINNKLYIKIIKKDILNKQAPKSIKEVIKNKLKIIGRLLKNGKK